MKNKISLILLSLFFFNCQGNSSNGRLKVGAEQPELYLSNLADKRIGLMVNQSSLVDSIHLVDFLISKQINVQKIFAVEHGFRGGAANGEKIDNSVDQKTGLPIISLYGKKKKASTDDLQEIDLVIFDLQDVGCRFYTYISSMHYMMEACAENNISMIVLDRPNPNGDYIDGPVLDMKLSSFVGMHPIPIVHGCTVGELAQMINSEGWLNNNEKCDLTIIPVSNYSHSNHYDLPVKPSPNLPNSLSIRLYPSLCFFEATNVSIGRGTHFPFQVIGFPNSEINEFSFTPKPIPGMNNSPLHNGQKCQGIDLRKEVKAPPFTLRYFIQFFNDFKNPEEFWKSKRWIDLLSGDSNFYDQINNGLSEEEIKATWQSQLVKYKQMRKKYLLYPDHE
jgi:uncharacterized protein YbbC (DUF1343 family)